MGVQLQVSDLNLMLLDNHVIYMSITCFNGFFRTVSYKCFIKTFIKSAKVVFAQKNFRKDISIPKFVIDTIN